MASKQLRDDLTIKFRDDVAALMDRHTDVWSVFGISSKEQVSMITATFIQALCCSPYPKDAIMDALNAGYEERQQ